MAMWRPRSVAQLLLPALLIPPNPFVSGLPAHPVPPAQLGYAFFLAFPLLNESMSFFHDTGRLPAHEGWFTPFKGKNVSTMCPDRTVNHVPGLDLWARRQSCRHKPCRRFVIVNAERKVGPARAPQLSVESHLLLQRPTESQ